jgi:hypothetical protein
MAGKRVEAFIDRRRTREVIQRDRVDPWCRPLKAIPKLTGRRRAERERRVANRTISAAAQIARQRSGSGAD